MSIKYRVSISAPSPEVAGALKDNLTNIGDRILTDVVNKWPVKTGKSSNAWDWRVSVEGKQSIKISFVNPVDYSQYVIPKNNPHFLAHRNATDEGMWRETLLDAIEKNKQYIEQAVLKEIKNTVNATVGKTGNVKVTK